jgi:hypothetical protein
LENVPLSLITATSVGICSLNDDGSTNPSSAMKDSKYKIHAYRNSGSPQPDYYRKFVTTYNYNDKFLDYTDINLLFEPDPNKKFQPMFRFGTGIGEYKPEFDPVDPDRLDVLGGRSKKSKKYRKSISCFKCGNSCCKCCAKSKKRNKKSKKTRKTVKKLNQHKRRNRTLSNKRKNRYSK